MHLLAGGGVVPVSDKEGTELAGIDARTGRDRWKEKLPAGPDCHDAKTFGGSFGATFGSASGDGTILPLKVTCGLNGFGSRTVAIDPATGHRRWWWKVTPNDLATSHGYTLVGGGGQGFFVIGPDGRQIAHAGSGNQTDAPNPVFTVTAGHAVVAYEDPKRRRMVLLADVRTGATTSIPLPAGADAASYTATATAGGKVYAVTRQPLFGDGYTLRPGALDVIDPAAATIQRRPLPFAVNESGVTPIGVDRVAWLGAAGGRLYMGGIVGDTEKVTVYAAHPGTPAELGGVPLSDWPDACTIAPGHTVYARPKLVRRIGAIRFPRLECTYTRDGPRTVKIAWVAETPDDAKALLDVHPPVGDSIKDLRPLRIHGADAAYGGELGLYVRAGRYVLQLSGDDAPDRALAHVIAEHLRSR